MSRFIFVFKKSNALVPFGKTDTKGEAGVSVDHIVFSPAPMRPVDFGGAWLMTPTGPFLVWLHICFGSNAT